MGRHKGIVICNFKNLMEIIMVKNSSRDTARRDIKNKHLINYYTIKQSSAILKKEGTVQSRQWPDCRKDGNM